MKRFYPKAIICLFVIIPLFCGCIGSPTEDPFLPGGDLQGINLEPENVILDAGNITKFLATGIFPGGATYDLTPFVSWISSDPSVAFFLEDGTLVANAPGNTTISSVYIGVNSQSISVTVPGAPTPGPGQEEIPVLRSITVTPKFITIEEEGTAEFTCTGNFSDDTEQDYSSIVEWHISDPSLGFITAGGIFVSTSGFGLITVSAKYGVFESNYVVLAITEAP